jgi:hypothetical protein
MANFSEIGTFGDVSAEQDDAVLSYFLKTEAVDRIASGDVLLVLGRKGAGKTALTKYFSTSRGNDLSVSLSLRDYPWNLHAQRRNLGASDIESYVSSWQYLITVKAASLLLTSGKAKNNTDSFKALNTFLVDNYGAVEPRLGDILRPAGFKLSKGSIAPSVMGNALGGVEFERKTGAVPAELDALTDTILEAVLTSANQSGVEDIFVHFDELDQGLSTFDARRKEMIIGLILAARSVSTQQAGAARVSPVIYLRTDLWEELRFSDKNKISQSSAVLLEWTSDTLLEMINERIRVKLGEGRTWASIEDGNLMRGSQPKWNHIISRTFLRPRDVIQFLNFALQLALRVMPEAHLFENSDIQAAREPYSRYLKQELDDEIGPHWEYWLEALQACSELATITFAREDFVGAYNKRRSPNNVLDADAALATLYQFSVIGYRRGIGTGGSGWVFQYTDPDAGWDNAANQLKVHQGLKEFAKLREERVG